MKSTVIPTRAPLTNAELELLTANDFARLKLTDEEKRRLRAINQDRQKERAERSMRLKQEEEQIVGELKGVGCNVSSVWDLVNTSAKYPEAIPVLLRHLMMPYSDRTREGIARSLAVVDPLVRDAWPLLMAVGMLVLFA